MWSHQPAGRPVTGMTRLPASRSRSSAPQYAAAVSRPSCRQRVVDVGEDAADRAADVDRHRGERAHRRGSGGLTPRWSDSEAARIRGHGPARRRPRHWPALVRRCGASCAAPDGLRHRSPRRDCAPRHPETAFRSAPEHVVRRARPFLANEPLDFARGEAVAEMLTEVSRRLRGRPALSARAIHAGGRCRVRYRQEVSRIAAQLRDPGLEPPGGKSPPGSTTGSVHAGFIGGRNGCNFIPARARRACDTW